MSDDAGTAEGVAAALDRLSSSFTAAAAEFSGSSAIYARLARYVASRPTLALPLLHAPRSQRRALLYFASMQYLLRRAAAGHRLREYLPVLGGTRPAGEGLIHAFAEFVEEYREPVGALCASRTTQTNEVRRAAMIRPAFGRAAGLLAGRTASLIELGCSAGLLLLTDRYRYRYHQAECADPPGAAAPATIQLGPTDATLELEAELRGSWPAQYSAELTLADRTGVDLHPLDPSDPDQADWLRSCIWPEHTARLSRLDAALQLLIRDRPRLVTADLLTAVPALVADAAGVPLLLTSHALTYLPAADRTTLVATVDRIGRQRDLMLVLNEARRCGLDLVSDLESDLDAAGGDARPGVPPPAGDTVCHLTLVAWLGGQPIVELIALTDAHGAWLEPAALPLPYRPPVG